MHHLCKALYFYISFFNALLLMCNIQLLSPSLLKLSGSSRTTARQKITRPQRERIHRLVSSSWQAGKSTTKRKKAGCFLGSPFSPSPLFHLKGSPLKRAPGSPQNPAPEMAGENMDLLSDSLAQLRRFSAASHHGSPDDLSGGPQARLRRPLP